MKKIKRKPNEWTLLIAELKARYPSSPLKKILEKASKVYRKRKQRGGALPSAPVGIAPVMKLPRIPTNKYLLY